MQETWVWEDPVSGRSLGGWNGNPLHCSCLESPMDRGAWRATVHGSLTLWSLSHGAGRNAAACGHFGPLVPYRTLNTWQAWVSQCSRSVVSDSLRPHESQHARPPCSLPTPGVYSNSCPLSWWCHPAVSSSIVPFSSCPQSLQASGSFQMSHFFASGGQSIGVSASASVLPMNIQDWFPLGWTGWISLQSKGLSRIFSNTTVQKHQFFGTQLSL